MRIAVPCEGPSLDSEVSMHFGRTPYFAVVDVENGRIANVEFVRNPFEEHMPGQIPNFLHSLGVDTIISYGMGVKARMYFERLGIRVVTGAYGRVRDVIEGYLTGTLKLDLEWEKREGFHRHSEEHWHLP